MKGWSHHTAQSWGPLLCLGLWLILAAPALAQGPAPGRPRGAGVLGGAIIPPGGGPGTAASQPPQPLSASTKISVDERGLSVEVLEQDFAVVMDRIAELARIEVKHLDNLPNRRVSIRFTALPVVEGLRRLLRAADVPGYLFMTDKQDGARVQRIVFLPEEGTAGTGGGRVAARAAAAPVFRPPNIPPQSAAVPPPTPLPQEEPTAATGQANATVFDEVKSNAAARRLLSQMMHPNDQVRERAMEGLVRIVREDSKQRELLELLTPLMEDLGSEDQATQDAAREEIRKMLAR